MYCQARFGLRETSLCMLPLWNRHKRLGDLLMHPFDIPMFFISLFLSVSQCSLFFLLRHTDYFMSCVLNFTLGEFWRFVQIYTFSTNCIFLRTEHYISLGHTFWIVISFINCLFLCQFMFTAFFPDPELLDDALTPKQGLDRFG